MLVGIYTGVLCVVSDKYQEHLISVVIYDMNKSLCRGVRHFEKVTLKKVHVKAIFI